MIEKQIEKEAYEKAYGKISELFQPLKNSILNISGSSCGTLSYYKPKRIVLRDSSGQIKSSSYLKDILEVLVNELRAELTENYVETLQNDYYKAMKQLAESKQ